MIKIFTAAQMREIDRKTIEDYAVPGVVLMENAGIAVVEAIKVRFPGLSKVRVNIFAGKGNNGGDGAVIARHLLNLGSEPTLFLAAAKEEIEGDARTNLDAFINMGGRVKEFTSEKHIRNFKLKFMHTSVVVDALLGTGAKSAPRGFYAQIIEVMNSQGKLKVAVDIPSGVMADSGATPGVYFKADLTVTLGAPKIGLLTQPGCEAAGKLLVADISIPKKAFDSSPHVAYLLEKGDVLKTLPKRSDDSHKGSFGHLSIAAGSVGMGGAAYLAGAAALRIGVGLVSAALPKSIAPAFETALPEMMTFPLPDTDSGAIAAEGTDKYLDFSRGKSAILLGPGLSTDDSTKTFVARVVTESEQPMVIDADGLNCIGEKFSLIKERKAPTIVTPHPGEMARLTGQTSADIQKDRIGAAISYANKSGAIVVLKGAGTVIATPEGEVYINPTGNNGLATAGAGDVLAGIIAGLLAQGVTPIAAAFAGVYIHGALADEYRDQGSDPRSLIAGDLLDLMPSYLARTVRDVS